MLSRGFLRASWVLLGIRGAPIGCPQVARCAIIAFLATFAFLIRRKHCVAHLLTELSGAVYDILDLGADQRVLAAEWQVLAWVRPVGVQIVINAGEEPHVAEVEAQAI